MSNPFVSKQEKTVHEWERPILQALTAGSALFKKPDTLDHY